jgi:hypothetical protein
MYIRQSKKKDSRTNHYFEILYLYRKNDQFWNRECLLGNYSQFISETGQMYQNKKVDVSGSKFHYAVVHAITFYGTLVVIWTFVLLVTALSKSIAI